MTCYRTTTDIRVHEYSNLYKFTELDNSNRSNNKEFHRVIIDHHRRRTKTQDD